MYTVYNYRTKKALKDAVKAGEKVTVFDPGGFIKSVRGENVVYLEGPHFPEPHRWYAQARVKDNIIVSVK